MALQRDTKYPGRFTTATSAHPQGSFKNRTSPTSQDGSYLEKDWLNDWDGFFGSLLSKAGLTPDGNVDAVGASQYFNALLTVASVAPVGTSRNLKCSIPAANTTATFTADELVLGTSLSGSKYHISSLNKSITLTTTGAGGMDTGSAPVSGYVAIYAIYNPTTGVSALLGYDATSAVAPEVYGGSNMPSGYTASALIGVWPTNSSGKFIIGSQKDRRFDFVRTTGLTTSTQQASFTSLSLTGSIPPNAKVARGDTQITTSTGVSASATYAIASSSSAVGASYSTGFGEIQGGFSIQILTAQTVYYISTITSGTMNFCIYVCGYDF